MTGRPTKYKKEYNEQVTKLAKLGATDKEIADFFDVCEKTLNNWKTNAPEFLQSLKGGKAIADANVTDRLYQRAMGYEHKSVKIFNANGSPLVVPYTEYFPPDTTACIFWLKNRKPATWRDKQEFDHTTKGEKISLIANQDDLDRIDRSLK